MTDSGKIEEIMIEVLMSGSYRSGEVLVAGEDGYYGWSVSIRDGVIARAHDIFWAASVAARTLQTLKLYQLDEQDRKDMLDHIMIQPCKMDTLLEERNRSRNELRRLGLL